MLFTNAIRGNPVIASDIYRLIGIAGKNQDTLDTLYTYCDVDTFVQGLETSNEGINYKWDEDTEQLIARRYPVPGHTNLITALFKVPSRSSPDSSCNLSRYINKFTEQNNNDLIQIRVTNDEGYRLFAEKVWKKSKSQFKAEGFDNLCLLNYFIKLLDYIKACKTKMKQN